MANEHTYWKDDTFQATASSWFMANAIDILSEPGSYSESEVRLACDVVNGQLNINTIAQAVSTNSTIGTKIKTDDFELSVDIEYIVKTAHKSGSPKSLFKIVAEAKYPVFEEVQHPASDI